MRMIVRDRKWCAICHKGPLPLVTLLLSLADCLILNLARGKYPKGRKAKVMCDGVTNLETVTRSLGHGLDLVMRLDRTCAEHDGVVFGYGAIFHGLEMVQTFEPVQFSDDDDGRVRFHDAVSLVEADASMQIALAEMMGIIPPT